MSTHDSTINRDSQAYWNKRAATFTRHATSDYERWLLDLLALEAGETILDMGCATGTLAVPLARAGHRVHGCDFAEAMLAILDERAAAEILPVTSHLLAWEDDWEEAGLGQNSADVAFASRSLMSGNVFSAVRKLDAAARSRAAVVVPDSLLPSRDPRLLTYLRRLAGPKPFTAREQRLFDAYAEQHFVREDAATASEKAGEQWGLDYPLPVTWVFIGWRTDGSEWA